MQLVHLVRELPEYDSRLAEETLRRASDVLSGIDQVLERYRSPAWTHPPGPTTTSSSARPPTSSTAPTSLSPDCGGSCSTGAGSPTCRRWPDATSGWSWARRTGSRAFRC
ncbi:hypothetical protein [Saccharopolyspora spinosa]|uniref:hypothetical protein n=1 Tax=Saccharopolyspora spinosa TaxID=60894 RepID=UPI00374A5272